MNRKMTNSEEKIKSKPLINIFSTDPVGLTLTGFELI